MPWQLARLVREVGLTIAHFPLLRAAVVIAMSASQALTYDNGYWPDTRVDIIPIDSQKNQYNDL